MWNMFKRAMQVFLHTVHAFLAVFHSSTLCIMIATTHTFANLYNVTFSEGTHQLFYVIKSEKKTLFQIHQTRKKKSMGSPKTSVLINDITIYSENIVLHRNERHFPDIIGNYKEIINFKL